MRVRFHAEASAELAAAAEWYGAQRRALGSDFLAEVARAVAVVAASPATWPVVHQAGRWSVRRFRLARFPFPLLYVTRQADVLVAAVAHDRRKPGYWIRRL